MKNYKVLNDELEAYGKGDYYPFHMPGHKRNKSCIYGEFPVERDITEIEGFDNLHHAEGILKEVQEKAAKVYGTLETFYSVNGSTAALLSAVSASVSRNGKILMARNCHKAVYHAAYLRNLRPVYIYPQLVAEFGINGGISPEDVDNFLKNDKKIEAVLVTSPTYDGVVSDIKKIAEICHKYGVPLIVDEAHGAHFKFSEYFPVSAVELGADLVIQSVHKTLPSMTQTALLHRCSDRVDREKIQMFMGIYQTSSPSYILMASIDSCMEKMRKDGEEMFREYCKTLDETRKRLGTLKNLKLLTEDICGKDEIYDFDKSKILIFTKGTGISGRELHEILLKEYHLEMEMDAENYVVALTSVGDTKEGFVRLCEALEKIDKKFHDSDVKKSGIRESISTEILGEHEIEETMSNSREMPFTEKNPCIKLKQKLPLGEALEFKKCRISIEDSEGHISAEVVYLYPPGIPILVPGEQITGQLVENMRRYINQGLDLQGLSDYSNKTIYVIKE